MAFVSLLEAHHIESKGDGALTTSMHLHYAVKGSSVCSPF